MGYGRRYTTSTQSEAFEEDVVQAIESEEPG